MLSSNLGYLGLFIIIYGWFMVGLKSVGGWIEVHVGIQGVYIKVDGWMDGGMEGWMDG